MKLCQGIAKQPENISQLKRKKDVGCRIVDLKWRTRHSLRRHAESSEL